MCSCPWLYSPKFWARLAINFSRWPYWIEYGGKVDAFIESRRKITHSYLNMGDADCLPYAQRYSVSIRPWVRAKLIR